MASAFFRVGEVKKRPGVYQRHENVGLASPSSAMDGYCAIPVRANWGPLGKVVKNTHAKDLTKTYGAGTYNKESYTVPAAAEMFAGGASVVYTYRLGTGGAKASKELSTGFRVVAKYPGTMAVKVAIKEKLGSASEKQFQVYVDTSLVEEFVFSADKTAEGEALINAVSGSNYITIENSESIAPAEVAVLAVADGALTGGTNPTITNNDYSNAFSSLETYHYNTIALDVDDDENMTLGLLLKAYKDNAYQLGKTGFAVVGEKTTVAFDTRCTHAKSFNDGKVVYLGGGWKSGADNKDGVLAICHTAGVIAATESNQSIVHHAISGATELCEDLSFAQYEQAIVSGMLMVSMSRDGTIWYDSGITTLVTPDEATQDDGWKKIRRAKTRFEMSDRIDLALAPKVGRVTATSSGVADIIQTAQRVLDQMANSEGKLAPGASFVEDTANPHTSDSAWFIIQAYDYDSLEKIYLTYQFRYSQNS